MYAIIRRYQTEHARAIIRKLQNELVPLLHAAPGFVAYYVVDEGNGVHSSISIFEDPESAEYSNKLAAHWVREHPMFIEEPPDIASGDVLLCTTAEDPQLAYG